MLEPLFDAELDYQPGMAPQAEGKCVEPGAWPGLRCGSGEAQAPGVPARARSRRAARSASFS